MKRPHWLLPKEQYSFKSPRFIGRVLVVVLALLIVVGVVVGASLTLQHAAPSAARTYGKPRTLQSNTIHYDDIQQTPVPGAAQVTVSLAEYTIASSLKVFHPGTTYYFVVSNRGHVVHEFLILPENADGSLPSPAIQYNDKLLEIEQIAPGTTMRLNYTFSSSSAGRYEIACQMRGHYQAGMKFPIRVIA